MITTIYTVLCALLVTIIVAFSDFCLSIPDLQKQAIAQNKELNLKFAVADVMWFALVTLLVLPVAIWALSSVTTKPFFNLPMLILSTIFLSGLYLTCKKGA